MVLEHPPSQHAACSPRGSFDFTGAMHQLCADVAQRLEPMRHIQMERVVIATAQARKASKHGTYASLTPLRFEGGAITQRRKGRTYRIQPVVCRGQEMLYILTFYLPRFMEVGHRQKLITVFHELWHISPDFNGDLRRHPGRCYAHTHSQKNYDAAMEEFVEQWLAASPPDEVHSFLSYSFPGLQKQFGRVIGRRIRRPKLLPIEA